jgi:hypothetical protein
MNKLDTNEYLGRYNCSYEKKDPKDLKAQYEVHPQLLRILHKRRFVGDDISEDLYEHTGYFEDICWTVKLPYYTEDEVKLKLFSQTLTNTGLSWYRHCPTEFPTTWDKLSKEFQSRFYPNSKANVRRR